jgi:2'-5' RNA ligase
MTRDDRTNDDDTTWRVFCAIEVPPDIRQAITNHIALLRQRLPNVSASWPRAENVHLTLKFLGDIPVERVEVLSQAVRDAAASIQPFDLVVKGCGSFPPRGQPRVLWIGIEDATGSLNQLYQTLETECAAVGFAREERPFHPHLTIARLRQPQGARQMAELHKQLGFDGINFRIKAMSVIRSELRPEGSHYSAISTQALGAQASCLQVSAKRELEF